MAKQKQKNPPPSKTKTVVDDQGKTEWTVYSMLKFFFIATTVFFLWFGHYAYLFTLFENDRFFSHLSDVEREMSFRTEMGLYFSYYKTLVEAPSFQEGIYAITHDNITEAGHTINTLQRFNLYPEVYLSLLFRIFRGVSDQFKIEWQSCFQVRRGSDLPPVTSCEGIGNLHYFYIHGAFLTAGSVLSAIFLLGYFLSQSYFGGLTSVVAFMVNHGHATRAQWTPPLRETFGYPVFCFQLCLLTWTLKKNKVSKHVFIALTFLTTHFILFWQFSGFVLFTQVTCIFCAYVLGYLSITDLTNLVRHYILSFILSFALLFGNLMLLSSLFFTSLIATLMIILFRPLLRRISNRFIFIVLNLTLYLFFTFLIKFAMNNLFGIHDDSHVFDILRSKFTTYSNFHTSLYTCAAEFDFVDGETLKSISQTGLLPLAVISFLLVALAALKNIFKAQSNLVENKLLPVIYNAGQFAFFCLMAILIMRLKLFAVPYLCAFVPVIFNQDIQLTIFKRRVPWANALIVVYIGLLAFQGQANVQKQLSIRGEFNNEQQERLFRWVIENTNKNDVFAGSMALMANLKLTTLRPIFNHPHYEDSGIRERTLKAYSIYSRKKPSEVHELFKSLGIRYFVFESQHCGKHHRAECTYLDMWDKVDEKNRGRPSICSQFMESIEQGTYYKKLLPFTVAYNSQTYAVLQI